MKKITIRDVAKHAGVGLGTVSRVLNNSDQVSPKTRQRVMQAMDALGYQPSASARQLARKMRPRNIGVVTRPFLKNYYSFAERLRGVQQALHISKQNYELMLFSAPSMSDYEERLMNIVQTGMIEGLLMIDLVLTDDQQAALEAAGIPFVSLTHRFKEHERYIGTDNILGGKMATEYLIKLGHRRIAYVGDKHYDEDGFATGLERYLGYQRALRAHGVHEDARYQAFVPHGYEQAYAATWSMLDASPHPTALFAMSDTQALGCIAAIREYGLHVPNDISVIGYDNLEISYHIGLTSVHQHLELSGRLATDYLLQLMNSGITPTPPELPSLLIVERNTVKAI